MAEVTIEGTLVTGPVELRDRGSKALPTKGKVWLCRCGASTKKPLCDGTHFVTEGDRLGRKIA